MQFSTSTIALALLGLVASVHGASASSAAPYPTATAVAKGGVSQIADGQIQATGGAAHSTGAGIAKPTAGVAKPSTAPKSSNSTVPFKGDGNQVAAGMGGVVVAIAAAVAAL